MENSKSIKSNTGYKGINFDKRNGKFEISIAYRRKFNYGNGDKLKSVVKRHYIGYSDTLKEAITVREDFIKSLF